jgi:Bifunctional DNA primase/polymerase, N-terminal
VLAIPLAERGIPVIPVEPSEKRCLLPDWQRRATTSLEQIAQWNAENPNYNVGCVAEPDGIVLDCDVKGLMRRIEEETGHKFPATLVVRSAGRGCAHVYFLQTELSRKLGNRKAAGLFDLQSVDKYVVGPQSRLDNGRIYEVVNGCDGSRRAGHGAESGLPDAHRGSCSSEALRRR